MRPMLRALLALAVTISLLLPQGAGMFVQCKAEEVVHVDHACCPEKPAAHPDDCCEILPESDERGLAGVAVLPAPVLALLPAEPPAWAAFVPRTRAPREVAPYATAPPALGPPIYLRVSSLLC